MSQTSERFNFHVSANNAFEEIKNLSTCKVTQSIAIPVKILIQNADIFSDYLCHFFNFCVNKSKLPNLLNPFLTNVSTLYPLKTSKCVFSEYKMGTLANNGLNKLM